ncbi:hypothetical protein [Burkholderia cenocepacia]|uniref:hypothetical protein n=1 Tax=Burkholderia cenocepacia TaxID=95486 RepID=UPI00222F0BED|nr:hypothetical protein [Burkholderia cenocepacia]MCW3609969.1 hypothetical protein [Burkholderia cenocepacia]MCW5190807.1 hypothetical protein [Burkholderia cenocepacia]
MTTDINDIPPWEGPDLLAEAREAARKAGEAAEFTRSPSDAKPLAPRKERTWADVEAGCASAESKAADSIQTPTRKLPAWLQKARQENAKISARTRAERAAKGKQKPASASHAGKSKLTEAQVAVIWRSTDTGAALAARYGVSAMTISNIRNGKLWGGFTATLGEPGVTARKRKGVAIEAATA